MINKNKKGSHVGIVLSFTLFITFLIFAYVVIGPPASLKNEKKYVIESIKGILFEKLPQDVMIASIYEDNLSIDCFRFDFDNSFEDPIILANDGDIKDVGAEIYGNEILIQGGQHFSKVYLTNNSFEDETALTNETPCEEIVPNNILNEKRITEKGIIALVAMVEDDYDEAKNYLEVRGSEFSLHFVDEAQTVFGKERILINGFEQIKTNVYARTYKVDYLNVHGEEKMGELIIKVW